MTNGYYCSPDDVRRMLGYSDITLTDIILEQYISYAQAYVIRKTNREFTAGDGWLYILASGAVCNLAAFQSIIRPAGGAGEGLDYTVDEFSVRKSGQLDARQRVAVQFLNNALRYITELQTPITELPFSSTQLTQDGG